MITLRDNMSNDISKDSVPTSQNEKISLLSGAKQFKTAISDRFNNPIFFAYLTSWCIFNWDRISILIYSKKNIIDRIDYIKSMPSNTIFIYDIPHATTIWLPLVSTIFLVCLSPYISIGLDFIHKSAINKKIENNEILTQTQLKAKSDTIEAEVIYENKKLSTELEIKAKQDESRAKSITAERNIEDLQSAFDTLSATIENTQKANDRLSSENESLTQKIESASINLTKLEDEILTKAEEFAKLNENLKDIQSVSQRISILTTANDNLRNESKDLKLLVHQLYMLHMGNGVGKNVSDISNTMSEALKVSNEVLNINNYNSNQQS